MKLEDCQPGMKVIYVPAYAAGDASHPDCEKGVITSVQTEFVFVWYGKQASFDSIATRPESLLRYFQGASFL